MVIKPFFLLLPKAPNHLGLDDDTASYSVLEVDVCMHVMFGGTQKMDLPEREEKKNHIAIFPNDMSYKSCGIAPKQKKRSFSDLTNKKEKEGRKYIK